MSNPFETPWTVALPGFPVYGIFQARILEWGAISFSWGSSPPRGQTHMNPNFLHYTQILYCCTTWEEQEPKELNIMEAKWHICPKKERAINCLNAADKSSKSRTENGTLDLAICPSPIKEIKQKYNIFMPLFHCSCCSLCLGLFSSLFLILRASSHPASRLHQTVSKGNRWHTQIRIIRQRFIHKGTNFKHVGGV